MKDHDRLRELRVNTRLRRDEVAAALGVTEWTWGRYERGEMEIPPGAWDAVSASAPTERAPIRTGRPAHSVMGIDAKTLARCDGPG